MEFITIKPSPAFFLQNIFVIFPTTEETNLRLSLKLHDLSPSLIAIRENWFFQSDFPTRSTALKTIMTMETQPFEDVFAIKTGWCLIPIASMYGTFTYIWMIFMVNVGKYTIHGCYGIVMLVFRARVFQCPDVLDLWRQMFTGNPEVETIWVTVEGDIETKDQPGGWGWKRGRGFRK